MTYSLIGAKRGTQLKIVALALVCSVLVWFTIYSSQASHTMKQTAGLAAMPQSTLHLTTRAGTESVCRISAL